MGEGVVWGTDAMKNEAMQRCVSVQWRRRRVCVVSGRALAAVPFVPRAALPAVSLCFVSSVDTPRRVSRHDTRCRLCAPLCVLAAAGCARAAVMLPQAAAGAAPMLAAQVPARRYVALCALPLHRAEMLRCLALSHSLHCRAAVQRWAAQRLQRRNKAVERATARTALYAAAPRCLGENQAHPADTAKSRSSSCRKLGRTPGSAPIRYVAGAAVSHSALCMDSTTRLSVQR